MPELPAAIPRELPAAIDAPCRSRPAVLSYMLGCSIPLKPGMRSCTLRLREVSLKPSPSRPEGRSSIFSPRVTPTHTLPSRARGDGPPVGGRLTPRATRMEVKHPLVEPHGCHVLSHTPFWMNAVLLPNTHLSYISLLDLFS